MKKILFFISVLLFSFNICSQVILQDTIRPDSDASPNDWTCTDGGSGTCIVGNYTVVDETTYSDSDYVGATTKNLDEEYGMSNSATSATISYLRLYIRATGNGGDLLVNLYDGTGETSQWKFRPSGTYGYDSNDWSTDSGGGSWDLTEVNNLEVRVTTEDNKVTSMSHIYVEIWGSTTQTPARVIIID